MIVYLDMDGVIADFVGHSLSCLGLNKDEVMSKWSKGHNEVISVIGMSKKDFWLKIDSINSFWEDIPVFDYANDLVKIAKRYGEVHICSAPHSNPKCLYGKTAWLLKNKFWFGGRVHFTKHKYHLAKSDRVLIDDTHTQVENFIIHGGHGLLFPQHHNNNHHLVDNRLTYVENELKSIKEKLGE